MPLEPNNKLILKNTDRDFHLLHKIRVLALGMILLAGSLEVMLMPVRVHASTASTSLVQGNEAENITESEPRESETLGLIPDPQESTLISDGVSSYSGTVNASAIIADGYGRGEKLELTGDMTLILDTNITFAQIDCDEHAFTVEGDKTLTIRGDSYYKKGIYEASMLTLNSGTIKVLSKNYDAMSFCGDIIINDGAFIMEADGCLESKYGNITINGGEVRANYKYCGISCKKKLKITGGTVTVMPLEGEGAIDGIDAVEGIEITGGVVSCIGYMRNDFEDIIIGGTSKVTVDNSEKATEAIYMFLSTGGAYESGKIKISGQMIKPAGGAVKLIPHDDAFIYTVTVGDKAADYVEIICGGAVIPVSNVALSPVSKDIYTGDTFTVNATISPAEATIKNVTWSSSDPNVASVTASGLSATVKGVAPGSATIRATATDGSGKYADCIVKVTDPALPVTGVSLNPASATIKVGGTQNLTASITPSNATNKKVTWSSSDPNVASVTGAGLSATVKGVAPGSATIRATATDGSGKYGECTVTVADPVVPTVPVTLISLDPASATLIPDKKLQLTATISPDNATNKNLTWSSSDTKIAKVNSNGEVTAIASGSAKITAVAEDGSGITATAGINVAGMTLNDTVLVVRKGKTSKGIRATLINDTIGSVTPDKKGIVKVTFDKKKGTFSIKGLKVGKTKLKIRSTAGIPRNLAVTVKNSKVTTTKLKLSKTSVTLAKKNKKAVVTVTATPDRISTGENIIVSSSNKKIAKVSVNQNTGKVTIKAVSKGKCTVTVKAGKKSKTINVRVKK